MQLTYNQIQQQIRELTIYIAHHSNDSDYDTSKAIAELEELEEALANGDYLSSDDNQERKIMADNEVTKVMFRKFESDIIALFPEVASDMNPAHCESYVHVGQHGEANLSMVINASKPALPEEYKELHQELKSIGYTLWVVKKTPQGAYEKRKQQILEWLSLNQHTDS
jgi:hypothetical protein